MRWVFDIPRNASFIADDPNAYDPVPANETLRFALQARDHGCVGFGLGGYEVGAPPEAFAHAFVEAKQAGLKSVPHAGETVGPSSVWGAVHALQADRIGHGVRAVEDPLLVDYLRERQIPLEISLTSNLCLHVFPSIEAHPFAQLDQKGLYVTLNSDDPPLFNTTLVDEYIMAHQVFGYGRSDLARLSRQAFAAAAVEDSVKSALLAEFDQWAQTNLADG